MAYFLVLKCVALIGFAISDSAILKRPPDVSSCVGENITIAWEYGNPADIVIALWTFDNGTLYNIVRKVLTGNPAVQPSSPLNVEFIENGTIQLIDTLSSYTGTYALSLTYSPGSPDSDSVNITINDVPQPLVFQENVTTHTITCSGSFSIPTVIRVSTSDGTFRYEASPYTSSVTSEGIECCYNGSAANCSTETFTATYDGTIYCQQVRDAPTTVPPTTSTTTQTEHNTTDSPPPCEKLKLCTWLCIPCCWCITLICIVTIILIIIVVGGCTLGYWKYKKIYLFDTPRKWPCSSRYWCYSKPTVPEGIASASHVEMSGNSSEKSNDVPKGHSGKPPDGERIASASHVEMGDISSEKSSFVPKGLSGDRR